MATLANLRSRVSAVLGISADVASHADQTEADARANEAVLDFLMQTACYVVSTTAVLDADGDTTLSTNTLLIKDAYTTNGGSDYRIEQVTPNEIIDMRLAGATAISGPVRFYALNGANLIMAYPKVADTLTLYHVPRPTAMTTGANDPSDATYGGVPVEYHPALEAYMLWKLGDMDDDQSSAQGERYRELYENWVRKARTALARKANVRQPRARVGRRRFVTSDPSADIRW